MIPGLPTSIIGSILNQLVKTVGLLGVSDMVLYFRERESHDRTKQALEEMRAERAAERQMFQEQIAEDRRFFMEQLNRRDEQIQLLLSESRARNGDGHGDGHDNGHESAAS